jgi:hypothetical protein
MIGELMAGCWRMFRFLRTRACWPRLRRLGAIVLHAEEPCEAAGTADAAGAGAGESVGAAVGAGDSVGAGDGVGEAGAARVSVGGGMGEGVAEGIATSVLVDAMTISVGRGAAGGVVTAHPRRSIRTRIAVRMSVTTSLNKS